jgi:hypothetical protein
MLSVLLYAATFFVNGWLAYKMAQPADRQGLLLFISIWLLLQLLNRTSAMLLPVMKQCLNLFKKQKQYTLHFRQKGNFGYQPVYNLLYGILGLLLWVMAAPASIWEGYLFILTWQILALGLLGWFIIGKTIISHQTTSRNE